MFPRTWDGNWGGDKMSWILRESSESAQCQHMLHHGNLGHFLNTEKGRRGVLRSCADHSD